MPRACVLIPTHDHWATLPLAVRSALDQTVPDVEVIVIGDGVTERTRAAAQELCRADQRVRFLDLPKGPNHGEVYRGQAIAQASSDAIFYLCDDDLLLPRHVENLLGLLAEADLVQCRNGYVHPEGALVLFPTDLADPQAVAWHLRTPRRNATSLTGTAHRRATYLDLPEGWTTTPPDEWPDHYMWKKFFRFEGFRGATHPEMTAVQLPTSSGRELLGQAERQAELVQWRDRLAEPGAHEWLQEQVNRAAAAQLAATSAELVDLAYERTALAAALATAHSELADRDQALAAEEDRARAAEAALWSVRATLDAVVASRSWRVTAPLRSLARRVT